MLYPLLSLLAYFIGAQVQRSELCLLIRRYNYRLQPPQWITYLSAAIGLVLLANDTFTGNRLSGVLLWVSAILATIVLEWLLARISPKNLFISFSLRFVLIMVIAYIGQRVHACFLIPFFSMGYYVRNTPFGVAHGKPLFLAYYFQRRPCYSVTCHWQPTKREKRADINVTDYGILPNLKKDVTNDVQALIDYIGLQGGGCLFFPKGKYLFNTHGKRSFLQINYSHITIEGETDEQGKQLTEFVMGGTTIEGSRNPWLSPFFITTGESLQPSNQFWGVNFRKPCPTHKESISLSDPGSDGELLTPPLLTHIKADAYAGTTHLQVEDSSKIGKYIILAMYNTTREGKLLKDLLGVDELRDEWLTARRAGPEEAPSFQWLVEVKRIVDTHTIELATPLWRDCLMTYEPALFQAEMLEDIHIRHLSIHSTWNGLFRHHGFPLYYTIRQTQEMDYGWNAINMKRCAHSSVEDLDIQNFTNPLYVQDSYAVEACRLTIRGYDGHQGVKMYCHTSNCKFHHIDFLCHYADMMGGEGNAYGNTFSDIRYLNPTFHPVDFDFHGFPEGPMSPPAYNLFIRIEGFRYIKSAGAIHNLPSCATHNVWSDIVTEGERHGSPLFYAMTYRVKSGWFRLVTAIGFTVAKIQKTKKIEFSFILRTFQNKLVDIDRVGIPQKEHDQFFPHTYLYHIQTTADLQHIHNPSIKVSSERIQHKEPLSSLATI